MGFELDNYTVSITKNSMSTRGTFELVITGSVASPQDLEDLIGKLGLKSPSEASEEVPKPKTTKPKTSRPAPKKSTKTDAPAKVDEEDATWEEETAEGTVTLTRKGGQVTAVLCGMRATGDDAEMVIGALLEAVEEANKKKEAAKAEPSDKPVRTKTAKGREAKPKAEPASPPSASSEAPADLKNCPSLLKVIKWMTANGFDSKEAILEQCALYRESVAAIARIPETALDKRVETALVVMQSREG